MQGLSFSSLKRHPALIPLYICVGAGVFGAAFYVVRLATKSPEVTWDRKNNPEPWNEYANKQHKFYSPYETTLILRAQHQNTGIRS